ncbi:TolC family protein [Gemmatimonas sp.]|uniref:TolC family protein n=1 Tax=Gemmatimonas sp. TaxID=1962908 RepID=UPI003982F719
MAHPIVQQHGLDSLVRLAEVTSPALRAAHARLAAARARIRPAGARPDPMLMTGIVNLPLSQPSFSADEMTMRMVGLGQTIPYPGKRGLQRRAAAHDASAADAALAAVRLEVIRAVRDAYYDVAYATRALALLDPNRQILADIARIAEVRYGSGIGSQQDVLRARVEATRVAEMASMLLEQRRASLALLNAALDRASDTPVLNVDIPDRLARAAVATSARDVTFLDASLGARAAGSALPPLATLQALASEVSPVLRQRAAMVAAQAARAEFARSDSKPDFDVSLQYGQRQGRPDMVTAQVSVPLRLQKAARQNPQVAEARAERAALEADYIAARNGLNADVARLLGLAEQNRTLLALYAVGILPQGRTAVVAALASYRTGQSDMTTVLTAESALFASELAYVRAMTDFAKAIAALEQATGSSVLPEERP